jgi:MFS family permease
MGVFTMVLIAEHLPYAISPIFGGLLRDFYGVDGLRLGFGLSGFAISMLGLVRLRFLRETIKETKKLNAKMAIVAYKNVINDFRRLNPVVKKLIFLRSFLLLVGISMFFYFAVLYAVRYVGIVSFTEWGWIMALASVFYLLALPLAKFAEKFRVAPLYGSLVFLGGLGVLIFLFNTKLTFFLSMILLNICGALTFAIERSAVAWTTEWYLRGRAETFMNLSFYAGATLGPCVGGLVYAWHPPLLIVLTSVLLIGGSMLSFTVFKGLKQQTI